MLLLLLPALCLAWPATARSEESVAVEWRFDTEGDQRGWVTGGHIRDADLVDKHVRTFDPEIKALRL